MLVAVKMLPLARIESDIPTTHTSYGLSRTSVVSLIYTQSLSLVTMQPITYLEEM